MFERSENAKFYIVYIVYAERSSQPISRFEGEVCPYDANEFEIVNDLMMKGCHMKSFFWNRVINVIMIYLPR